LFKRDPWQSIDHNTQDRSGGNENHTYSDGENQGDKEHGQIKKIRVISDHMIVKG
jgi:hypothetical protein